jgi:hypothetical protein
MPAPKKPSPAAQAYADVLRARFDKLTPEELEKIKEGLDGNVRRSEAFSKAKLNNGDEPDFIFIA